MREEELTIETNFMEDLHLNEKAVLKILILISEKVFSNFE
jgi:hypothetical protein